MWAKRAHSRDTRDSGDMKSENMDVEIDGTVCCALLARNMKSEVTGRFKDRFIVHFIAESVLFGLGNLSPS